MYHSNNTLRTVTAEKRRARTKKRAEQKTHRERERKRERKGQREEPAFFSFTCAFSICSSLWTTTRELEFIKRNREKKSALTDRERKRRRKGREKEEEDARGKRRARERRKKDAHERCSRRR